MPHLKLPRRILARSIAALISPRFLARGVLLPGAFLAFLDGTATQAATYTWNNIAGGSWTNSGDWTGGGIPGNPGDVADFSELTLGASQTITLDANQTVGTLLFGDQGDTYSWTLANGTGGPWTLTLASSSGSPVIDVVNDNATISAVLAGTAGLTKTGAGDLILTGQNTYTGTTAVTAGTLTLDFSQAGLLQNNIINSASGLTLAGGALNIIGSASQANQQSFAVLTLNAGYSTITATTNATPQNLLISLGDIVANRSVGGTVNFVQPNGTIGASNGFVTTSANDSGGILGGWATVGGTDWAVNNGTNIVALASYYTTTTGGNTASNYTGKNVQISSAPTFTAAITPNSIQVPITTARTVTFTGTNVITSGGILVSSAATKAATFTGGTLTSGNGSDLIVNQFSTANLTIASTIANDGATPIGLTISGSGTGNVILTAANTYTGPTTINGTSADLTLNVANAIGTSAITINNGGTLTLGAANGVGSASTVTINGGTWATAGDSNAVAGVTLAGGSITNASATLTSSTNFNLQSGTVLSILAGASSSIGVTKSTAGTVDVTGVANTYTGVTTIDGGILNAKLIANIDTASSIGEGSALGSPADLVFGGGTLQYTTATAESTTRLFTIGDANGNSATIDSSTTKSLGFTSTGDIAFTNATTHNLTLTGTGTGANLFDPSIADQTGTGNFTSLTKNGTGSWTLGTSGTTNTYSGATTINAGTLTLGVAGAISSNSAVTINAGTLATAGLADTVASLTLVSGSITGAGPLTSNSITLESGTVSAVLAGTGGIAHTTNGSVTLSGVGTFTGGVAIQGGTIQLGVAQAFGNDTNNLTLGNGSSGGTVDLNGKAQNIKILATSGTDTSQDIVTNSSATAATLEIENSSTFGGLIQNGSGGGGVAVTIANGATVTFTGANSYTGNTLVQNATLVLSSNGNNHLSVNDSVELNDGSGTGGVLQLGDSNGASNQVLTSLTMGAGTTNRVIGGNGTNTSTLTVNNSAADLYQSFLGSGTADATAVTAANDLALTKMGGGTLTLGNASITTTLNTYDGGTNINQGTLQLGIANALPGASTLTFGSGTLTSGAVNINGGTLDLNGFSSIAGAVTLASGSIINSAGSAVLSGTGYAVQSGTISAALGDGSGPSALTKTTGGTVILSGANTYTGGTNVNAGTLALGVVNTLASTGAVTVGGGTLDLAGNSNTVGVVTLSSGSIVNSGGAATLGGSSYTLESGTVSAALGDGASPSTLTKTTDGSPSGGTVTLSGVNSYTGGTNVSAGTLILGAANALSATGTATVNGGTLALGAANALASGGAVDVNGGTFDLVGFSSAAGGVTLTIGSIIDSVGGGTLSASSYTVESGTISAVLGGSGSTLTKTTGGTVTLSAANTYTGLTSIQAGTLNVSTTHAGGGAFTVNDGGTLDVNLSAAGQSLATSALTLGSSTGGTLTFNLGTFASTTAPAIINAGALTLNGTTTINVSAIGLTSTGDYPLISYTGSIGGSGSFNPVVGLPARVDASLVTTVPGLVELDVTSIDYPKWTGAVNGNWDTSTQNWQLAIAGTPTTYLQGAGGTDSVLFDDSATGTRVVNLTTTLTPTAVTVDNSSGNYTFTGPGTVSGATTLTKEGTGTLFLQNTGANNFSGTITISGGTLQAGDGSTAGAGQLGSGNIVLSGGSLALERPVGDDFALANIISGAGTLTQQGGDTVTLTGNNSAFNGSFNVTGGVLKVGNSNGLGTASGAVGSGGILDVTGFSINNTLTLNGGAVQATAGAGSMLGGPVTLSGGGSANVVAGATLTISGAIGGSGGFTTTNGGLLILTGSNTYDTTAINAGTLQVGAGGTLGSLGSGAVTDNGTLIFNRTDNYGGPVSNNISGTGALTLNSGTLTLGGANTYTGATTISAGTLRLGGVGALGNGTSNTSGVTVNASGGALDLGGISPTAGVGLTLNGTGVSGGGALTNSSATAATYSGLIALGSNSSIAASDGNIILSNTGTITGSGNNLILDGSATGSSVASGIGTGAGTLTKQGTGTWTLSGADTYTGATTINVGTLRLGAVGALGNGTNNTAGVTVSGGAALDLGGISPTASVGLTVNGTGVSGGGALTNSSATAATYSGLITLGGSSSIEASDGSIILSNTGTITGSGDNLVLGGTASGNSIASIIGTVAGTVTVNGTGTWALTGANTYTGITNIDGGILNASIFAAASTASSIGKGTLVFGGGTLQYNTNTAAATTSRLFTIGDGNGNSATIDSSAATSVYTLSFTGTGALTLTNTTVHSLTLTGSNTGNNTFSPLIADQSAGNPTSLNKEGAGTWLVTGTNTYTGVTTIDGGILNAKLIANIDTASSIGAGSALGSPADVVFGGGTLQYTTATAESTNRLFTIGDANGNSATIDSSTTKTLSFTGTGSIALANTAAHSLTLTGSGTGANIFDPVIGDEAPGDPTSLTKSGAGSWTLGGVNTYSGATTINGGTLALGVDGAIGSGSAVTIGAGTLDVAGFTTGAAVTLNGGTLLSSTGSGGAVTGTVTLNSTSTINAASSAILTLSNNVSGAGGLTKTTAGTLILSGSNNYSGGTTLTSGTLQFNTEASVPTTGFIAAAAGTTVAFGYALDQSSLSQIAATPNAFTIALGISSSNNLNFSSYGAASLGANASVTYSGTLTPNGTTYLLGGGGGTLTASSQLTGANSLNVGTTGSGTVLLTGANSYTGGTTVTAGTLQLGNASALGPSTNALTVTAGTLDLEGFNTTVGSLTGSTGGTITDNSATAGVTYLTDNIASPTGTSTFDATIANGAAGRELGLVKAGAGTLVLNKVDGNTYTGGTFINAGTLDVRINNAQVLPSDSNVTFTGSGTLLANNNGTSTTTSLTLGSLSFDTGEGTIEANDLKTAGSGGGTISFTGALSRANGADGNFTLGNGATGGPGGYVFLLASGTLTDQFLNAGIYYQGSNFAAYDTTNGVRALNYTSDTNTANVVLSASATTLAAGLGSSVTGLDVQLGGTGNITDQTTETVDSLKIAGANNFTLDTPSLATLTITSGGLLKAGGNAATISGGGGITTGGAGDLVIRTAAAGDSLTIATNILGSTTGGLTTTGVGTVTLAGSNNAYSGATTINGGTVAVSGSINGTTSVLVNNGGTLGGNGTITTSGNGNVTVANGGNLAPGLLASPGTLTLSLGSGLLDLSGAVANASWLNFGLGTTSDELSLTTGVLNLGSGFGLSDFNFTNAGGFGQGTYVLFATNNQISGTLGADVSGTVLGLGATLQFANGGDELVLVVVPEPGALTALLGGLGALLGLQRLRRSNSRVRGRKL